MNLEEVKATLAQGQRDKAELDRITEALRQANAAIERLKTDEDLQVLAYDLNDARDDLRELLERIEWKLRARKVPPSHATCDGAHFAWTGEKLFVNGRHYRSATCAERCLLADALEVLYIAATA